MSETRSYFTNVRRDIETLLPEGVSRLLDVGCGAGFTAAWLKQRYNCWAAGIEVVPSVAQIAEENGLDQVLVGDIERMDLPIQPSSLDLVLCLDVLEHLVNPWEVVVKLAGLLKPGGSLIVSMPNVQHYSVSMRLIFGKWEYQAEGLLDRTHLRFFVWSTLRAMLQRAGLRIVARQSNQGIIARMVDLATFRIVKGLLAYQFLVCAVKDV